MTTFVAQRASLVTHPPFRLRWVLLFAAAVGVVAFMVPRAMAAWRMYSIGPAAADYALCMAGPTGLGLFRNSPGEFRRLVRRRLVAAGAGDRPFARCAGLAETLGASVREKSALGASARLFQEWAAGGTSSFSLDDFDLTIEPVNELYERAWPWLRGDKGHLIQPSLSPPTAVHPREPIKPAWGRGLPDRANWHRAVSLGAQQAQVTFANGSSFSTYFSTDGYNWREVPRSRADHEARCSGPSGAFSAQVGVDPASRTPEIRTFRGQLLIAETPVVPSGGEIVATSCDDKGILLLVRRGGENRIGLCLYQDRCRELTLPTLGVGLGIEKYPLDIARANGTTIVAVTMGHLVRVASTRNDGSSWTPFSIAFDAEEWGQEGGAEALPNHLLALGSKVMLYAGYRQAGTPYPVLVSEDFGASFRGAKEARH